MKNVRLSNDPEGAPITRSLKAAGIAGVQDDQEGGAILRRVDRTFAALRAANSRVARCKRPDSLEAARKLQQTAESEYRDASLARDQFVETFRARTAKRRCRHTKWLASVDVARRPIKTCSDCGVRLGTCASCNLIRALNTDGLVAYHDFPEPCRAVCRGSLYSCVEDVEHAEASR